MNRTFRVRAWLLAGFLPACVQAATAAPDAPLHVQDAWIRSAPPGAPVMAGYARLENRGSAALTILAVRADGFGRAELHDMREADGVMRMRPLAPLELAPAGRLALQPGGAHLMLMQPAAIPAAGTRVVVEFELADGRRVAVPFEVRAPER